MEGQKLTKVTAATASQQSQRERTPKQRKNQSSKSRSASSATKALSEQEKEDVLRDMRSLNALAMQTLIERHPNIIDISIDEPLPLWWTRTIKHTLDLHGLHDISQRRFQFCFVLESPDECDEFEIPIDKS